MRRPWSRRCDHALGPWVRHEARKDRACSCGERFESVPLGPFIRKPLTAPATGDAAFAIHARDFYLPTEEPAMPGYPYPEMPPEVIAEMEAEDRAREAARPGAEAELAELRKASATGPKRRTLTLNCPRCGADVDFTPSKVEVAGIPGDSSLRPCALTAKVEFHAVTHRCGDA